MSFLNQEIDFDIGHLILLLSLIGFIYFVSNSCTISCDNKEKYNVKSQGMYA